MNRGKAPGHQRGFTLVEILIVVIILGILAAIVVPQFTNATQLTRENTLKDELRFLRAQIGVYKGQHEDTSPGYANGDTSTAPDAVVFSQQMTGFTDRHSAFSLSSSAAYPYGPYLSRLPPNPITGKSGVVLQPGAAALMPDASLNAGWIYNPQTEQVIANIAGDDSNGVSYASY